jgi:hypothetical protein
MMRNRSYLSTFACAVALTAMACGGGDRAADDRDTVGTAGQEEKKSVTLSGCLQRGDGNEFMLSQASEAPQAVGTSGTSGEGTRGSVEGKQTAEASRTYRLSGDNDELGDLVGHQVRISGTVEDRGNVAADSGKAADRDADTDRRDIDEDDLAEIDVASVESIAKTCGTGGQR